MGLMEMPVPRIRRGLKGGMAALGKDDQSEGETVRVAEKNLERSMFCAIMKSQHSVVRRRREPIGEMTNRQTHIQGPGREKTGDGGRENSL
jgi:hypothetical protein